MIAIKRVYVYEETYKKVMNWAKENYIKNEKGQYSFPSALEQFIRSGQKL